MSRALATILAAALMFAAPGFAQTLGGPAPALHTGTRLAFPPSLGGATLVQSLVSLPAPGGRHPIYSYQYVTTNKMEISVFVFDVGRFVPTGADGPAVVSQFAGELAEAEQRVRSNGLTAFERPAVPSTCTYGSVAFRCIIFSATSQGSRVYAKMMMTGFRDSFVTIRIDWSTLHGQTIAEADRTLEAFVSALMH
ncbi:MAG: hypothetical protein ACHQK9_09715 [Reyranellales bacterium]